jgi:hypothetical protein
VAVAAGAAALVLVEAHLVAVLCPPQAVRTTAARSKRGKTLFIFFYLSKNNPLP